MTTRFVKNRNTLLLWIPLIALVMRLASPNTANASYFLIAVYALTGRQQVIQALFLSWLFSMLSEGVAPVAVYGAVGRYFVIAAATMSVIIRNQFSEAQFKLSEPVFLTVLLGLFFVLHSILVSPFVDVSVLKAISWMFVMATVLAAWAGLGQEARDQLERQMFYGLIFILVISLPLLGTGVGYLRNDTGFQGVLSHPQVFGPTTALIGAWLGARLIAERRIIWWQACMLVICLVLIVLSESRTAGLAMVIGLILSLPIVMFMHRGIRSANTKLPWLVKERLIVVALTVGLTVLLAGNSIGEYLGKRGDTSGLLEAADLSRGVLVYTMLENITEHPLSGIGFGVASFPSLMDVERDSLLGLPTSATVEKGVMPIAILEELGVPGFILVVAWFWWLIRRAALSGLAQLAVIATALLTNLGESMFFSPGGMGLLLMILVGWAATEKPIDVRPVIL